MADAEIPPVGEIELICPNCGYDLRGIASTLCPECGQPFDRDTLAKSQIPWVYRSEIGRRKAYLRTAWLSLIRPRALASEIARPVSFADADSFRRATIWIIWPTALAAAAIAARDYVWHLGWSEWIVAVAAAVGGRLFLISLTTSPGVFCRPAGQPPERRTRAEALSMYLCAALLGLVLATLLATAATLVYHSPGLPYPLADAAAMLAALGAIGIAVISLAAFWLNTLRLIPRATHCTAGRVVTAALLLPIIWGFTGAVLLLLLPGAVAYLLLVIHSVT